MKSFQLARLSHHDGTYHVFLTWGKSFEFHRHKAAMKFISATNRLLTAYLVELNDYYCQIHDRYRKNWLLFFHNKPSHGAVNYTDDRACEASLTAVREMLNLAFNKHLKENGSCIAFENFRKCIDCLIDTLHVLRKYHRRRSETVDVWQIDLLESKLQSRKQELDQWGIDAASKMQMKLHIAYQQVIPLQFTHKISSL